VRDIEETGRRTPTRDGAVEPRATGYALGMSEQPWGADAAVPAAGVAGDTDVRPPEHPLAYDPDEGGQSDNSPDPAVSGRRSPGTLSGL
jgi:hypothetical protein